MRWWRLGFGAALLVWVLGAAYFQARKRGRRIGAALLFVGIGIFAFLVAAFAPQPPFTPHLAAALAVVSIISLAMAMVVVLWSGFGR